MNRSKGHIKESAIGAACFAAVFLILEIGYQLTGARKFGGPAKPKSVPEVLHNSPSLVALAGFVFIVAWWWLAKKKEPVHVICRKCLTPFDKEDIPHGVCINCNGPLEPLEGFYERHPELGAKNEKPGKPPELETCADCGKTSRDCRDFVCPDCRSTR